MALSTAVFMVLLWATVVSGATFSTANVCDQIVNGLSYKDHKCIKLVELFRGPQGRRGPRGRRGARGPRGVPGPKGHKGDTGPMGPQGATGAAGETGAQGAQGEKGEAGPRGHDGAMGAQGPTGVAGPQGVPGEKGEQGEQGPAGMDGAQGVQGPPGAPGSVVMRARRTKTITSDGHSNTVSIRKRCPHGFQVIGTDCDVDGNVHKLKRYQFYLVRNFDGKCSWTTGDPHNNIPSHRTFKARVYCLKIENGAATQS